MRIFVTGARGFIGRHLIDRLRNGNGHLVFQSDYSFGQDITRVELPDNVDVVVHLAAVLTPHDPRLLNYVFNTNVRGTLHMLEESIDKGVPRFIFMSSAAVYECLNVYGASKLAAEAYCRAASDRIQTKIVRLFNAYGPRQMSKSGALVPNVLDALFNERPILLTGDGEQTRDFVFVHDVAAAVAREIETAHMPTATPLDLGTGRATSVNAVVEMLSQTYHKLTGKEPNSPVEYVPLDGTRQPSYSRADMTFPHLSAYTSLENGLWETSEFWRTFVHRPMPMSVHA